MGPCDETTRCFFACSTLRGLESEEVRGLLDAAFGLVAGKCMAEFAPTLLDDSHVEHIMCEIRKFLDHTTEPYTRSAGTAPATHVERMATSQ